MIWITNPDLEKQIKLDILDKIIQNDSTLLTESERAAIAEVQLYLRSRYDAAAVFASTGTDRNPLILMVTIDILLYHLHSRLNPRQIPEIRQKRYDEAKRMLEDIMKGLIEIDLPPRLNEENQAISKLQWGSDGRRQY